MGESYCEGVVAGKARFAACRARFRGLHRSLPPSPARVLVWEPLPVARFRHCAGFDSLKPHVPMLVMRSRPMEALVSACLLKKGSSAPVWLTDMPFMVLGFVSGLLNVADLVR
jgi:hypothetical protein